MCMQHNRYIRALLTKTHTEFMNLFELLFMILLLLGNGMRVGIYINKFPMFILFQQVKSMHLSSTQNSEHRKSLPNKVVWHFLAYSNTMRASYLHFNLSCNIIGMKI